MRGSRSCELDPRFREDLLYWVDEDRKSALRIMRLMEAALRDPFAGEGKPERLDYLDPDPRSRHITQEHRLVYHVPVAADRGIFLPARSRDEHEP